MTNVRSRRLDTTKPIPQVDLADPTARAEWLAAARSQADDLIAAADDATAPPGARELGRRGARRIIGEASGALRDLLDAAGAPVADRPARRRATAPRKIAPAQR